MNEVNPIILFISIVIVLWGVINYDIFVSLWKKRKERKAMKEFDDNDAYIKKINKITKYKKG